MQERNFCVTFALKTLCCWSKHYKYLKLGLRTFGLKTSNPFTWACGATVAGPDGGVVTGGHGARNKGAHFSPSMTVTIPTAVVPTLAVLVPPAVHRQT